MICLRISAIKVNKRLLYNDYSVADGGILAGFMADCQPRQAGSYFPLGVPSLAGYVCAMNPKHLPMIRFITIALISLCGIAASSVAQEDSVQNLYFARKSGEVIFEKDDYQPGRNAFYIYRNCVYNFVLADKIVPARVIDIRNDSIYYTRYTGIAKNNGRRDTLALHPGQLKKIRMLGDRAFMMYTSYSLMKSRYVFEKSPDPKTFPARTETVYSADGSHSTTYDLIPYLTLQGLDQVYEQHDTSSYYEGIIEQRFEDTLKKNKPPVIKKWAWFTPSNANKISGLNIGLQTMTLADNDSLVIHGVNLNADILSTFAIMYAIAGHTLPTLVSMSDTADKRYMKGKIAGLSISGGGVMDDLKMCGLAINGFMSGMTEVNGVQITGLLNVNQEFKGLMIGGLYNTSVKGRGLQIGLVNICKDLKGIQLGIWNVNSKRKLPLINWNF